MKSKDIMILVGTSLVSMAAGIAVGCIKEKIKLDTCCCIDEM